MLRTLRSRDQREQDFIKAATDVFLDPNADGDDEDDAAEAEPEYTAEHVSFIGRVKSRAGGSLSRLRQ